MTVVAVLPIQYNFASFFQQVGVEPVGVAAKPIALLCLQGSGKPKLMQHA